MMLRKSASFSFMSSLRIPDGFVIAGSLTWLLYDRPAATTTRERNRKEARETVKNHMVCRIAASFSGVALLFGVLLGGGRAFAQGAETRPADAATTMAAGEAATNQRIDALQQMLEQIQKELVALKQARAGVAQPEANVHPQTPPQTQALLSSSSASDAAASTAVAESTTVAASQRSTPHAEVKPNPNDPHSEPFAWGDFTWLTGNPRTKDTPYATEFFTPEIRVDANYTYDFRHPKDDTISGSSEVFRSNEVQLTQLGVGGDLDRKSVV